MSNDSTDLASIREQVNPVFHTAKSCLQIVAALGDADSQVLLKELGMETFAESLQQAQPDGTSGVPLEMLVGMKKIMPALSMATEARFEATNRFMDERGAKVIVDLPCGYTARGMRLARKGDVQYFGLDLPAVAEPLAQATDKLVSQGNIAYKAVDATNYQSLADALEDADGELFITTEGMLMYFTQSELEETFKNVHDLFIEHGGCWVTTDASANSVVARMIPALVDDPAQLEQVTPFLAKNTAKTQVWDNAIFKPEEARAFVDKMGFELEEVSVYDYLPEVCHSMDSLTEEKRQAVRACYKDVFFWIMTPKAGGIEEHTQSDKDFSVTLRRNGSHYDVRLTGRLDTITSSTLLELYRKAEQKTAPTSITIDMKNLDYISSAGMRVLVIMGKDLDDSDGLKLVNMRDNVRSVIEMTGLDNVFC